MMRLGRWLFVAIIGLGQVAATLAAEGKDSAPKPVDRWHELTVSPRAIEHPLLKYRLLPAEPELQEGNAAPILLRLPWERYQYFQNDVPKFEGYLSLPLDSPKLRGDDIFGFYNHLKRAAYRRTADWQYPIYEDPLAGIPLPDLQGGYRIFGYGLSVWIRQRLAEGNLAQAREGILVGLAVSRHYARTPFLITQKVCANADALLLTRVAELVSRPDSPNLYWALTQLPRPLIDLRPSIELQKRFLPQTVSGLDDLDKINKREDWTRLALAVIQFFRDEDVGPGRAGGNGQVFEQVVKFARAELPDWIRGGARRVEAMSDAEAAVRWLVDVYDDLSDETTALVCLDPPIALPRLNALQKQITEFHTAIGAPKAFMAISGRDSYIFVRRIEREIDSLRIVEAIRHYAADHNSQLPESLEKIADLPIPNDPHTGKPFHYEVKDGRATLWGGAIPLANANGPPAIVYTIGIRK